MNNFDSMKTGKFISSLRKERELTIEQIAKYIGVTKSAVSQWEKGKGIKTEMLYAVARFFELSVDELVDARLNGESNNDFIKRNYDLSLCDFSEETCDDKTGEDYFSKLKQIKSRFFILIKEWALDTLNKNSNEELNYLFQYFERDDNYLADLKYGADHIGFFNENDVKKMIKQRIETLATNDENIIQWELEKFFKIKNEWMKSDIVCNTQNDYLIAKLLSIMNQPEKDSFLAINLKKEEIKIENTIFYNQEIKTNKDLTLNEIEKSPHLKTMLNAGCNIMKQFKRPSCLEKEDLNFLEGKISEPIEEISVNDNIRPYSYDSENGLGGALSHWKRCTYEQYKSFVDIRKTEYYKALVNYKEAVPLKYYSALKKYCMESKL